MRALRSGMTLRRIRIMPTCRRLTTGAKLGRLLKPQGLPHLILQVPIMVTGTLATSDGMTMWLVWRSILARVYF